MRTYFDGLAPIYDRLLGPPDPALWRGLLKLPCEGHILDAGGGTARVSAALQGLAKQVVVCDISHKMLRKAHGKGALQPVCADIVRLPFADAHFSRILVVDALHHFPRQAEAMAELVRVLAPGGRLVIEEFDIARLPIKALALLERLLLMGSTFPPVEDILAMIERCGLRGAVRRDRLAVRVIVDK